MAHNASQLEVGFDSYRLFTASADDPYRLWLEAVVDKKHESMQKQPKVTP